MAQSSVDSYINAQPEQAMSWSDYYSQYTGYDSGLADHPFGHLENFFTGNRDKAKSAYDAYLNNLNNHNEWLATQSARAYDKMMDDSKIQREMKDFEKAGLNPYLLINSGSVSSSIPSSSKASYDFKRKEKQRSDAGRNFALILLAAAKIAASFL